MKKRKLLLFAALLLIEIVLLVSRVGVISNGTLAITILQIPVILATIGIGLPYGLFLSGLFGLGTMWIASGLGTDSLDYLFTDPRVSLIPRIMIAIVTWLVYRSVEKLVNDQTLSSEFIASGIAAMSGTLTNTICVIGFLCAFYPEQLGISYTFSAYGIILKNFMGANTLLELIFTVAATLISVPLFKRRESYVKEQWKRPIRKTFQKWLVVFMVSAYLITMTLLYVVQTVQERRSAEAYIDTILEETTTYYNQQDADIFYRVGVKGDMIIAFEDVVVAAEHSELQGKTLDELGLGQVSKEHLEVVTVNGVTYLGKAAVCDDIELVVIMSESEVYESRNETAVIIIVVNLLLFIIVFALISKLLQDNVVSRIYRVNDALSDIQGGDLEEAVDVRENMEFAVLSDGINATVKALKQTMEEVASRMNQEMEFAREIQYSALPVADHVIPELHDFDILGTMEPAREVGGDFFDYFLIGEDKICFVIADVSGKGVPAALFMMTSKTLIKNFAMNGKSPAEILTLANEQLCENNEAGMFVTVWLGILDYKAGELEFANAGHNPPLLRSKNTDFVYMTHKTYQRSIMLGMRSGVIYHNNKIPFTRGDLLYLYTDGVTEANNINDELYGEMRLIQCLRNNQMLPSKELLEAVRADIDSFAGEAKQFDDITMIVLKGQSVWKKIQVDATYENTKKVAAFAEETLQQEDCPVKVMHQMLIVLDEIYSNVVKYSNANEFEFVCGMVDQYVYMSFIDNGTPYNPLEEKEPNIEASMEERAVGGLGIFMVKKMMDYTEYHYKNGYNIFTIGKEM